MKTVLTFGTFDVFHIGHLNILRRAASLGDRLVVGVSTDELNLAKKGRAPVYPTEERMAIVAAIDCVDDVFPEHSLEDKELYLKQHAADILTMGDDWRGKFDTFQDLCEVVYFPRTQGVSTTEIMARIRKYA